MKVWSKQAKCHTRRAQAQTDNHKPPKGKKTFKYGLEVPNNWKDAMGFDDAARTTYWQRIVENEAGAQIMHSCFDFKFTD